MARHHHHRRAPRSDAEKTEWLTKQLGAELKQPLAEELADGIVLCALANVLRPGSVKRVRRGEARFVQLDNIGRFLKAARGMGLPREQCFDTADLVGGRNMDAVTDMLLSLRHMQQRAEIRAARASKHAVTPRSESARRSASRSDESVGGDSGKKRRSSKRLSLARLQAEREEQQRLQEEEAEAERLRTMQEEEAEREAEEAERQRVLQQEQEEEAERLRQAARENERQLQWLAKQNEAKEAQARITASQQPEPAHRERRPSRDTFNRRNRNPPPQRNSLRKRMTRFDDLRKIIAGLLGGSAPRLPEVADNADETLSVAQRFPGHTPGPAPRAPDKSVRFSVARREVGRVPRRLPNLDELIWNDDFHLLTEGQSIFTPVDPDVLRATA